MGTLCREVPGAARAVDPHVLVARARAHVRLPREGRALVERLEAGDAGGCQRPVDVCPNRHERSAPSEGVGEALERGRVEPSEVDLSEPLAVVEGVRQLARR